MICFALVLTLLWPAQDLVPQETNFFESSAITIDDTTVLWREYGAWILERQGEGLVQAFANQLQLERLVTEIGLLPDAEQIQARYATEVDARVRGAFAGKLEQWVAELAAQRSSPELHRLRRGAELRDELLLEIWVKAQRTVDEQELRQIWRERYGPEGRAVRARALRIRHSVLTVPGEDGDARLQREEREREQMVARLEGLRMQLLAGADWLQLALAEGQDPEAAAGQGTFAQPLRFSDWPAEVMQALGELAPGALSAPLYGRGHYQIFELLENVLTPFETVAAELHAERLSKPVNAQEAKEALQTLSASTPLVIHESLTQLSLDMEEIVFSVGEQSIARGTFVRWLAPRLAEIMLPIFVERFLVQRQARRSGIVCEPEEIQSYVKRQVDALIARSQGGSHASWLAELTAKGMNEATIHRSLAARGATDLLAEKLALSERRISEEEERALYHDRYGADGRALELRAIMRHLAWSSPPPSTSAEARSALRAQAEAQARSQLVELRRRAVEGGEDFGALAQEASQDAASASNRGRFVPGFPWPRFPNSIRAKIRSLKVGEVSEALVVGDEVWLFELVGVRDVSFESVRPSLREELQTRPLSSPEIARFLQSLVASARIDLHIEALLR